MCPQTPYPWDQAELVSPGETGAPETQHCLLSQGRLLLLARLLSLGSSASSLECIKMGRPFNWFKIILSKQAQWGCWGQKTK